MNCYLTMLWKSITHTHSAHGATEEVRRSAAHCEWLCAASWRRVMPSISARFANIAILNCVYYVASRVTVFVCRQFIVCREASQRGADSTPFFFSPLVSRQLRAFSSLTVCLLPSVN